MIQTIRTKIKEGGRVIIPAVIRQNLKLAIGDDIIMYVENRKIHITTVENSLRQLQNAFKAIATDNKNSLANELIAARRLEAKND